MTQIKLYLPTEMSGYQGCINHAKRQFAQRFGGFTAYDGRGGWLHDGELQEEPVTVLEAVGSVEPENARVFVHGVVQYIIGYNLYDESAIMFTIDGEKHLIES
jgi:hypothetical protein